MFLRLIENIWWFFTGTVSVRRIMKGSAELDKMKEEIKGLPPILIGFLNEVMNEMPRCSPFKETATVGFSTFDLPETKHVSGSRYQWSLLLRGSSPVGVRLNCGDKKNPRIVLDYYFGKQIMLKNETVKEVHGELKNLLKGMRKKFPVLRFPLKTLKSASLRL